MLLPRLSVASVCDQDPGRDGPHLPRHYQLGHSQYYCWRLVQFRYFQRRCADLPLEGKLGSGAPEMDYCARAGQGKGRPHAGGIRWEAWKMQETERLKLYDILLVSSSDDSGDDCSSVPPTAGQGGGSRYSEVQSTLRTLSGKVEDLSTCNDLIVKHGSALQR